MNAIGNSNRPVFINAKGVPQECNENPKNAALVGTDANGALASRSLGFLLENSGGVIKVKNNIPDSQIPTAGSGNVLPIGIDANRQLVPYTPPTSDGKKFINFSNVLATARVWADNRSDLTIQSIGSIPGNMVNDVWNGPWLQTVNTATSDPSGYEHELTGTSLLAVLCNIYRALTNKNDDGTDTGYTTSPPIKYHYGYMSENDAVKRIYAQYGETSSGVRRIKVKSASGTTSSSYYYFSLDPSYSVTDTTTTNGNVETRVYKAIIQFRGTSSSSISGSYLFDITRKATTTASGSSVVVEIEYTGTISKVGSNVTRITYKVQNDCYLLLTPTDLTTTDCKSAVMAYIGNYIRCQYDEVYSGFDISNRTQGNIMVKKGTLVTFQFFKVEVTSRSDGSFAAVSYDECSYNEAFASFTIREFGFQS